MAHLSTTLVVALILLSPITAILPSFGQSRSAPMVRSATVSMSYTSTTFSTYFGSTNGTIISQKPAGVQPVAFGFITAKGKCSQFSYPVTVTSGTQLNLQIEANNPVNLYLLLAPVFQLSPNGCTVIGNTLLAENNFTTYLLHWTAPSDGTFNLIFTGQTATVILMDQGSTKPVSETGTVTVATSTETSSLVYPSATTETYTTTTVTPFYVQPTNNYDATIGIAIALMGILLLFIKKRGHETPAA